MKKIQAKKKRDREEAAISAPEDGQVRKNLLDQDDDLPVLFT